MVRVHDRSDMNERRLSRDPETSKEESCAAILDLQNTQQEVLGANVLVALETGRSACLRHHVLLPWRKEEDHFLRTRSPGRRTERDFELAAKRPERDTCMSKGGNGTVLPFAQEAKCNMCRGHIGIAASSRDRPRYSEGHASTRSVRGYSWLIVHGGGSPFNVKVSCAALNRARSAAEGHQRTTRRLLQRQLCRGERSPTRRSASEDSALASVRIRLHPRIVRESR